MTQEAISPIRLEICDVIGDYRQIVHTLSYRLSFSQADNIEALGNHTDRIMKNARKMIKPKQVIDQVSEEQARKYIPILTNQNNEVQRLNNEMEKRNQIFNASMRENKKYFDRQLKYLYDEYNSKKIAEIKRYKTKMEKLQDECDRLQTTFDSYLASQIGNCIEEKNSYIARYNQLKEDFDKMKMDFETNLTVTDMKVERLSKQLKEMEEENAKQLTHLMEMGNQKAEELGAKHTKSILEKTATNKKMKEDFVSQSVEHKEKIAAIQKQIYDMRNARALELQKMIDEKQKELDNQIKEMKDEHIKVEDELSNRFDQQKATNEVTIKSLQALLDALKKQALESAINYKKTLEDTKRLSQKALDEKNEKLTDLVKNQRGQIEKMKEKQKKEIAEHLKQNEIIVEQLEQKLIKVVNEFDQLQLDLQNEVNTLIRQKAQLEDNYGPSAVSLKSRSSKATLQMRTVVVGSFAPKQPGSMNGKCLTTEDMVSRFNRFDQISHQRSTEFRDIKLKKEGEKKNLKTNLKQDIAQENMKTTSLLDEVRNLKNRLFDLRQKIQNELENNRKKDRFTNNNLKNKVTMQNDTIRQLNEEIQRMQVDDHKKVQLSLEQAEHRNKLKEIQKRVDTYESDKDRIEYDHVNELEEKLKETQDQSKAMIKEAADKLEDALDQYIKIKILFEERSMKDKEKWMELRTDIAESNLKVVNTLKNAHDLPHQPSALPTNRSNLSSSRKTPLPMLKK